MSYEGYEQWLCRTGHLHIYDCYDAPDMETWSCHHCGEPVGHVNAVDCTNEEAEGEQEFVIRQPAPRCGCCDQPIGPPVYWLPGEQPRESPGSSQSSHGTLLT